MTSSSSDMGAIGEVVPHSLATSFRADWASMVLKIYELKEWKALLGMQLRSFGEVDPAKLARPNELHSGGSATEMSFGLLPRLLVDFSHVSSPVLLIGELLTTTYALTLKVP